MTPCVEKAPPAAPAAQHLPLLQRCQPQQLLLHHPSGHPAATRQMTAYGAASQPAAAAAAVPGQAGDQLQGQLLVLVLMAAKNHHQDQSLPRWR